MENMKKCNVCGGMYEDGKEACPICGGVKPEPAPIDTNTKKRRLKKRLTAILVIIVMIGIFILVDAIVIGENQDYERFIVDIDTTTTSNEYYDPIMEEYIEVEDLNYGKHDIIISNEFLWNWASTKNKVHMMRYLIFEKGLYDHFDITVKNEDGETLVTSTHDNWYEFKCHFDKSKDVAIYDPKYD